MRIVILGVTGSVGSQATEIIGELGYSLVGVSFLNNTKSAEKIISDFKVENIFSPNHPELSNAKSYTSLIKKAKPDIVLNAISGFAGLEASISCLKQKTTLALANKESIIVAGKQLIKLASKFNTKIIPVDSEHAAIHELISTHGDPKEILVTGSGGPCYGFSQEQLKNISVEKAISHPKWNMGAKISVNSATHMNKCFELIEASILFSSRNVKPIYHPEAMVHSLIKTNEGTFGLESTPSMLNPIRYALTLCKKNTQGQIHKIDFSKTKYTFKPFETSLSPLIWADKIISENSQAKAIVLNAANELAVEWFLDKRISFLEIYKVIDFAMKNVNPSSPKCIFQIKRIDKKTRRYVDKFYLRISKK